MADFRHRVIDDFGPKTVDDFVEYSIHQAERTRTWGVWRDRELGGLITFEKHNEVMGVSHVIFKRTFWGQATTVTAMRAVYAQIFEAGFRKIASVVFEDNHAMRDLARKGGARQEGLFLDHTQRAGKLVNMVALGLTKGDFDGTDDRTGRAAGILGEHDGRADVDQRHHQDADVHAGAAGGAESGRQPATGGSRKPGRVPAVRQRRRRHQPEL
jgi:RimJ/RimL family protein N-acetyltransferase